MSHPRLLRSGWSAHRGKVDLVPVHPPIDLGDLLYRDVCRHFSCGDGSVLAENRCAVLDQPLPARIVEAPLNCVDQQGYDGTRCDFSTAEEGVEVVLDEDDPNPGSNRGRVRQALARHSKVSQFGGHSLARLGGENASGSVKEHLGHTDLLFFGSIDRVGISFERTEPRRTIAAPGGVHLTGYLLSLKTALDYSAALMISSATSFGNDSIATWLDGSSIFVALAAFAWSLSICGGMIASFVATTMKVGFSRHAA